MTDGGTDGGKILVSLPPDPDFNIIKKRRMRYIYYSIKKGGKGKGGKGEGEGEVEVVEIIQVPSRGGRMS